MQLRNIWVGLNFQNQTMNGWAKRMHLLSPEPNTRMAVSEKSRVAGFFH
jgi:hypothetical protein